MELAKKIVSVNPPIANFVTIKQNLIERKDGKGFFEILAAGDVVGTHGKTYLFVGFDEIHGYKTWDILEAMQLDPTRPDAITGRLQDRRILFVLLAQPWRLLAFYRRAGTSLIS